MNETEARPCLIGSICPPFDVETMVRGEFSRATLENFRGAYLLVLFYPLDFTFVCPTELVAFGDRLAEFMALNTHVLAVSVDSKYANLAWWNTAREKGGVGGIGLPLAADVQRKMCHDFGVLHADGVAYRGLFLVDREGIIRHATINDLPIGRDVDEALRVVQALQFHEQNGEVCPAGWRPGDAGVIPHPSGSLDYFGQV
jgi:alkyl hydroperoxide reductase subunit AhpC